MRAVLEELRAGRWRVEWDWEAGQAEGHVEERSWTPAGCCSPPQSGTGRVHVGSRLCLPRVGTEKASPVLVGRGGMEIVEPKFSLNLNLLVRS